MSNQQTKYFSIETGEIFHDAVSVERARQMRNDEIEKKEANERAAKTNPDFIQLTKGISPIVLSNIARESGVALSVLMFFFENMDKSGVMIVSQKTIGEAINTTRQSVANGTKILESAGAIGIGKVGNANIYLVNPEVAWQQSYAKRKTVSLKAKVIFGKEEAEELEERFKNIEVNMNEKFYLNDDNKIKTDFHINNNDKLKFD